MQDYGEDEWQQEMDFVQVHGGFQLGSTIRCPVCSALGFYGPRLEKRRDDVDRRYRACKFCGFWQEVTGYVHREKGGTPYRCIMVSCARCGSYDWKVPWDIQDKLCGRCGTAMLEVKWPNEEPTHPFSVWRKALERSNPHL